jgi:putative ABC transport system permease protein
MFKNYFLIAIRQMKKQKMYAAIKIGGFALSIAACILIALYIKDETSYDQAYNQSSGIYRLYGEFRDNGKSSKGTALQPPMAAAIKKDYPEVLKAGRLMKNSLFDRAGNNYFRRADHVQNSFEQGFSYADQELLDLLEIPFVYGNRSTALSRPNTLVLSKKKADKFYPGQNPVGKIVYLNDDNKNPYTIGGVMADLPVNTHLQFDYLLTLTGVEFWPGEQTGWQSSNYDVYLQLRPGTDAVAFGKKITAGILNDYVLPSLRQSGDAGAEQVKDKAFLYVQPVADIHLKSYDIEDGLVHGDIRFVWLFGAVALFILALACINFINLSTAKSANRAKEVGLRKVVGSPRSSIIGQFLIESLVFSIVSVVLALLISAVLLPYFNQLAGKDLQLPFNKTWFLPLITATALLIGLAAGIYPAFYLSAFQPIQVLKGVVSRGSKNSVLRNSLVIFQFTTSIVLIISTFIIYQQTQYILNREIGFNKDQVVLLQGTNSLGNKTKAFKEDLLKIASVQAVSISDYLPVADTKRNGNEFYTEGKTKTDAGVPTQVWIVDDDYIKTMGMQLVNGRNFSFEMPTDSTAAVINETLVKALRLKDPIGKRITNGWEMFTVVGVVKDFNYESMRTGIEGLVMRLGNSSSITSVKVGGQNMKATLADITAVWKKFSPALPIRYSFMDESFARMYADVQRMGTMLTCFAILAIIIACLGLFALSAFIAEQRTKEVGIRKVLGATIANITAMLSIDFLKLVLIAIIIASPIAWWAMHQWLQDFVYRINIQWWVFLLAAVIAICIAMATISFQSIKAALTNPVKSLKSE